MTSRSVTWSQRLMLCIIGRHVPPLSQNQTDKVLVCFWGPDGECGRTLRVCYGGVLITNYQLPIPNSLCRHHLPSSKLALALPKNCFPRVRFVYFKKKCYLCRLLSLWSKISSYFVVSPVVAVATVTISVHPIKAY